jgi:hypothetical protein
MPQERDYLERAAEAYREALNRYLGIQDFSNVGPNIRLVQRALNRVEKRLTELSGAATETVPSSSSAQETVQ